MVSATQLSSYLYCPRKLFINSVLLVQEPPKVELVKGNVWHETHENINNAQEKIVLSITTPDYQQICDDYRKAYSRILRNSIIRSRTALKEFNVELIDLFKDYWPSFEEEAKEQALRISEFISKHDVYGAELWEKLTPKILAEQKFKSERLNLTGIIDVLEIHDIEGKKQYVPVELKTGKYPEDGMWDGHKVQLAAYMLLLEDAGKTVNEAAIKYRGSEKRSLHVDSSMRAEVLDLIQKTDAVLKGIEPPAHTDNQNKCEVCAHKALCYNDDSIAKLLTEVQSSRKPSHLPINDY